MAKFVKIITNKKLFPRDFPFIIRKDYQETFPKHQHEFLEIFYISSGSCTHIFNDKESIIKRGDLFTIGPKQSHEFRIKDGAQVEITNVVFLPSVIDEHLSSLRKIKGFLDFFYLYPFVFPDKHSLNLRGRKNFTIKLLLENMLLEYAKQKEKYRIVIKSYLLTLLIFIARLFEEYAEKAQVRVALDNKRDALNKVIEYLKINYRDENKLSEMAKKANFTPSYFCRIFKAMTGKNLTEYVRELRIAEARRLLKESDMSIIEICFGSGFEDLSHFYHYFKIITGTTPKKYRTIPV